MKNTVVIFLILLVSAAFYFLGKKNGSADAKTTMIENVDMIKQIAELGALDVTGNLNMKVSNKGDDAGTWSKFKNYFSENSLQVDVPYQAKYGVDMSNQKMKIDTKAGTAVIYLPACKLLSLQLKMDRMETMSQTGIFIRATPDDLVKAQKKLYTESLLKLEKDPKFLKLSEDHIRFILEKYYKPLGYKVTCIFGDRKTATMLQ